jgi:hypothetical protein
LPRFEVDVESILLPLSEEIALKVPQTKAAHLAGVLVLQVAEVVDEVGWV